MKTIIFLLFFVSFTASADLAGPCPLSDLVRPNLTLGQVETHIKRDPNGIEIFTAVWAGSNPDSACCNASLNDGGSWRDIFSRLQAVGTESRSLAELLFSIGGTPGSRNLMRDPEVLAQCQVMADKVINPYRVVRNTDREDGARPMFTINSLGKIVPLTVDGVQIFVLPGRVCERISIFETTAEGSWTYVTNADGPQGIRGISLCRRAR